jgi:hypothetical protein
MLTAAASSFIVDYNPSCGDLTCYQRAPIYENKTIMTTASDLPIAATDAVTQNWTGLVAFRVWNEGRLAPDFNASARIGGLQTAQFRASDLTGNQASLNVSLIVADAWLPRLVLKGDTNMTVTQHAEFTEPGWLADDVRDGNLSDNVSVANSVDTRFPGVYVLRYRVFDSSKYSVEAARTITVLAVSTTLSPPRSDGSAASAPNIGLIAGCTISVLFLVICFVAYSHRNRKKSLPASTEAIFMNPTSNGRVVLSFYKGFF